MAVVRVGKMVVTVVERSVGCACACARARIAALRVCLLMMRVVNMPVRVFMRLVPVQMAMDFVQVQPHPERHQRAGCQQVHGRRFFQKYSKNAAPSAAMAPRFIAAIRGCKSNFEFISG